jgi:hypothetical protein
MRPVSLWFSNVLSLELRGTGGLVPVAIVFALLLPFVFIRRKGFVMFAASAGVAGYGMITLFLLQASLGNLYIVTALVLSLIMGGLAAGAYVPLFRMKKTLIVVPVLLASLFVITGLASSLLIKASPALLLLFIFPALIVSGFLTGSIYRVITADLHDELTGRVYASDLAGAALGYIAVSTLAVPLAGIMNASLILGCFILLAVALVSIVFKH